MQNNFFKFFTFCVLLGSLYSCKVDEEVLLKDATQTNGASSARTQADEDEDTYKYFSNGKQILDSVEVNRLLEFSPYTHTDADNNVYFFASAVTYNAHLASTDKEPSVEAASATGFRSLENFYVLRANQDEGNYRSFTLTAHNFIAPNSPSDTYRWVRRGNILDFGSNRGSVYQNVIVSGYKLGSLSFLVYNRSRETRRYTVKYKNDFNLLSDGGGSFSVDLKPNKFFKFTGSIFKFTGSTGSYELPITKSKFINFRGVVYGIDSKGI